MQSSSICHLAKCLAVVVALYVALSPAVLFGETDICGNEIRTFTEGNVEYTYQFIYSGDPRIEVGSAAVAAASHSCTSNEDDGLVAIFKSVMTHVFQGPLSTKPWVGFYLIVR